MKFTPLNYYLLGLATGAVFMLIFVILTERKLEEGSQAARARAFTTTQPTTQH